MTTLKYQKPKMIPEINRNWKITIDALNFYIFAVKLRAFEIDVTCSDFYLLKISVTSVSIKICFDFISSIPCKKDWINREKRLILLVVRKIRKRM